MEVERALERRATLGARGGTVGHRLAGGQGWSAEDVICTWGPADRPFEERHGCVSVSLVLSGTFQYRTDGTDETLVPGSALLGNEGQCFECGHEHASGDRCLAFRFSAAYFEQLVEAVGGRSAAHPFRMGRLPPLRALSPFMATANHALLTGAPLAWQELGLQLAATVLRVSSGAAERDRPAPTAWVARVTESVRAIESDPAASHTLESLANDAGLSPYHYLRTFKRVTGVTPHQFVLRTRLRQAAAAIGSGRSRIIDVAFDSGFGDLSNFNRAFRTELGVSPTRYRMASPFWSL